MLFDDAYNWQRRQHSQVILFKVAIPWVGILHIRILCIFPIKNVIYVAFGKFHLHGDFWLQNLEFDGLAGRKNTGNFLPERTSQWKRLRTAVSDLHSARLGFCLLKVEFCFEELLRIDRKCSETLLSMSSTWSTDYSRKDSATDVIEVEGVCTTNWVSNKNTNHSV